MLRLAGQTEYEPCDECEGKGKIPCPPTISSLPPNERGAFLTPGAGFPIPCPKCKGTKVKPVHEGADQCSSTPPETAMKFPSAE